MKQISNSNKLIIKILLTVIITTITYLCLFSIISASIIYKFDFSLDISNIFTFFTISLTALLVPYTSLYSLKSNGIIMGIFCTIPIIIFVIINAIIFNHSFLNIIIKLLLIIVFSSLSGYCKTHNNRKIKVK